MERVIKCDARCKHLILRPAYSWETDLKGKTGICGAVTKDSNQSNWLAEYFENNDARILVKRLEEIRCKAPNVREVVDNAEYPEWTNKKAKLTYYPSSGGGGIEH